MKGDYYKKKKKKVMPVIMLYQLKASISCVVHKIKNKFIKIRVSNIWSERQHIFQDFLLLFLSSLIQIWGLLFVGSSFPPHAEANWCTEMLTSESHTCELWGALHILLCSTVSGRQLYPSHKDIITKTKCCISRKGFLHNSIFLAQHNQL